MSVLRCCMKLPCIWMLGQEYKSHCFAACTSQLMKKLGHLLAKCWSTAICQLCPHACCLSCCNTALFWWLTMCISVLMMKVVALLVFGWEEKHCDVFVGIQEVLGLNIADWLFWLWFCVVFLSQMLGQTYSRLQLVLESDIGTCLQ